VVLPGGVAIDAKGGKDSLYGVDYAARTASEPGADMVKVNFPLPTKRDDSVPEAYRGLMFGRNVFQRGHDESLRFVAQLREILAKCPA
jgi:class I fructose-bisphosphate aldolase